MIDLVIVVIYLAILILIAALAQKKIITFTNFAKMQKGYLASKYVLIATIFASSIGGGTAFGLSEKAFAANLAHSYGLMIAIIVDILIAIYIVPKLADYSNTESVGDILSINYGKSGRYVAGFASIAISIGLIATQISVSGRIFEYMLGINLEIGVIVSYGIVVIYSTIGGFRSVLLANQLQFLAIITAIPIITIFGYNSLGYNEFMSSLPLEKIYFSHNNNLLSETCYAALGFSCMNLFPSFIQRCTINSNYKDTQKAIYIKSVIYFIFILLVSANGILAFIKYPEAKASYALPMLIDELIPTGLKGLVIIGLLAAVTSTADSDLNITTISFIKDIIKPSFTVKDQSSLLKLARVANFFIGFIAIYISLRFENVIDLIIFFAGFWGSLILVPLIFSLWNIKLKIPQFLFCCLIGLLAFVFSEFFYNNIIFIKPVFIGTLFNLITFLAMIFYNYNTQVKNIA